MKFASTAIEGAYVVQPQMHEDHRGSFHESFRKDQLFGGTGFHFEVAQTNLSQSYKGVIRGIHFKQHPPGQAKYISVDRGAILNVVIDLRRSSKTFKTFEAFELSSVNRKSLFLGYGLGNAFISLQDDTQVRYLCDSVFEPELEYGINPLEASIDWKKLAAPFGVHDFIISAKDRQAPALNEAADLLFD